MRIEWNRDVMSFVKRRKENSRCVAEEVAYTYILPVAKRISRKVLSMAETGTSAE